MWKMADGNGFLINQPGQVDLLCRFAVENREQDKKSCSLFFYDKIGFAGV